MIVTAVLGKVEPSNLPPSLLDSKMAALLRICRDCPKEQVGWECSGNAALTDRERDVAASESETINRGSCVDMRPSPVTYAVIM